MGIFSRISGLFRRGDEDVLSIPPMDGVFKPNSLLDTAGRVLAAPAIDNLVLVAGRLHFSSGKQLCRLDAAHAASEIVADFGADITMLAAAPNGGLAVATEGAGLWLLDTLGGRRKLAFAAEGASCITAGHFEDENTVLLAVGSRRYTMSEWKRDLMSRGATGYVVRYRLSSGKADVMRDGLAFPYGLARLGNGEIVVAESWRHRLIPMQGARSPLLAELPAYPARLSPAADGGFWMALFAPRRQLTELVLNDDDYRLEMMATIPPADWIGPDFADSGDGSQPLQAGSVRQMGLMKPWAPSRSYGLVLRLDDALRPVASFHSRADGRIHGIASVMEFEGHLHVASRGAGTLVRLIPSVDLSSGAGK
jgi:hypothetical protein